MATKRKFVLVHESARRNAIECIHDAPDGYVVTVSEETRTVDQNALLWPLLQCFARQSPLEVNGTSQYITEEEWKDVLSALFHKEMERVAYVDGAFILLGARTSKMGKREFSEFIEFIYAFGAARHVNFKKGAH